VLYSQLVIFCLAMGISTLLVYFFKYRRNKLHYAILFLFLNVVAVIFWGKFWFFFAFWDSALFIGGLIRSSLSPDVAFMLPFFLLLSPVFLAAIGMAFYITYFCTKDYLMCWSISILYLLDFLFRVIFKWSFLSKWLVQEELRCYTKVENYL